VSLESAKKYGFIASMIQVIMPIVVLATLGVFYYQLFYQIISGQDFSTFWPGVLIGVSVAAGVVGVIGVILFLLSMHQLSNYYNEPKIFRNIIYGFLTSLIGGIIICVVAVVAIFVSFSSSITTITTDAEIVSSFISIIGIFIAIAVGAMILVILIGVFYWKAFTKLGEKSGVDTFKTVGMLYLIGSILQCVGIGAIICWISWIFAAEGYRKLQPQPTTITNATNYTATTTTTSSGKIYCSYCGIENDISNSNYCKHCGKPLHTNHTDT